MVSSDCEAILCPLCFMYERQEDAMLSKLNGLQQIRQGLLGAEHQSSFQITFSVGLRRVVLENHQVTLPSVFSLQGEHFPKTVVEAMFQALTTKRCAPEVI